MKKVIVSVVGRDRPGIIASVSRILFDRECNLENVSQTILQLQFSGIFIATAPEDLSTRLLEEELARGLSPLGQHVFVNDLEPAEPDPVFSDAEPIIITTRGPDRKGLVSRFTEIIAQYGANVTNLQAVFKGGDDPNRNIMIYEVDVPRSGDPAGLYADLRKKAEELELEISIQHRLIFEAMNRI